jgi:hypothetical protein
VFQKGWIKSLPCVLRVETMKKIRMNVGPQISFLYSLFYDALSVTRVYSVHDRVTNGD